MPKLPCAHMLLAALVVVPAGSSMIQVAVTPDYLAARAQGKQDMAASRRLYIGREAKPEEIAGWDIDIRPDGSGLPTGKGAVKDGEVLFTQRCAGCHGDFGEGVGRWPALAGGAGTLTSDRPVRTIGSYWPYASTILDYVRRAQPFGNAQSLSNDELYAVTAYLLFLNDIVDQNFELTRESFRSVRMPNAQGFHDDDREATERAFWNPTPCMTNCKAGVKIISRARDLDATPAVDSRRNRVD
jgi:S-disulfanyl-L-cysteine oxidoreductase SoxD